jgi:hypothetical protein
MLRMGPGPVLAVLRSAVVFEGEGEVIARVTEGCAGGCSEKLRGDSVEMFQGF